VLTDLIAFISYPRVRPWVSDIRWHAGGGNASRLVKWGATISGYLTLKSFDVETPAISLHAVSHLVFLSYADTSNPRNSQVTLHS
jgi:hypothetical protein